VFVLLHKENKNITATITIKLCKTYDVLGLKFLKPDILFYFIKEANNSTLLHSDSAIYIDY